MEGSGWGAHTGDLHTFMKSHTCLVHDPLTSQGPGGHSQARAKARPFLTVATEGRRWHRAAGLYLGANGTVTWYERACTHGVGPGEVEVGLGLASLCPHH